MAYLTKVLFSSREKQQHSTCFCFLDMESSDQLDELFADGTEFTLHRLLSDFPVNDTNIDMNDLVKLDPMKFFDNRSISELVSLSSAIYFLSFSQL